MTAEEFKKYEGKRTTGRVTGCDLEGGRIIGYDENDDDRPLLAINDTSGWDSPSMNDVVIPNDKDRKDYFDGKHKYLWVGKNNVFIEKELDLTEILKGCEGVELWSDIFGKCELYGLHGDGDGDYIIEVLVLNTTSGDNGYECFTKYGRFYDCYPNGKCMLWPSETNRDWSTFKKPLKADDWVVACDGEGCVHINKYCNINRTWKYVIPFERYNPTLQEEELKKLSIV